MDAIFSLLDEERTNYIRSLINSFGCTYICLWMYYPQQNHLCFFDGSYNEEGNQPGPSSGSFARRLFDDYRREVFYVLNNHIPGLAFINNLPYRELNQPELLRLASANVQRQFYQEARIKTAVFMGCRTGEIEMGWSYTNQINMKNAMMSSFSDYNIHQQSHLRELSQSLDPNRPSSSSSLRSLDSPGSACFIFNIPTTSHMQEAPSFQSFPCTSSASQQVLQPSFQPIPSTSGGIIQQVLRSLSPIQSTTSPLRRQALHALQPVPSTTTGPVQEALQSLQQVPNTTTISPHQHAMRFVQPITPSTTSPHQQAMQEFALSRNVQLPTQESENAVLTRAIIAVLSSPSSSTSSNTQHQPVSQQRDSAFKSYLVSKTPARASLRRLSMLKRAITFYRSLNIVRRERMMANRPSSTQLHHVISERKRREKINESIEALRKLLPPEAKKDKASVLTRTREYLSLLKTQVEEFSERNRRLEAQLLQIPLPAAREAQAKEEIAENQLLGTSNERVDVRITDVPESTSEEERIVDLHVALRGECPVADLVIRILEFLKQVNNVNVISVHANTGREESRSWSRLILRLRIEGSEWDEAAFQEAVKRIVADLAQ